MPSYYSPPYDSPIEDAFAYAITKYLADDVLLEKQVAVSTICGRFVVGFILSSPTIRRIGIECDGRDFHDAHGDEWRDATILGGKHVESIYRLRGADITYHLDDLLYIICRLEPEIFSNRGLVNLHTLASDDAKAKSFERSSDWHHIQYASEEGGSLLVETRRLKIPRGQRRFWQAAFAFAESVGGGDLDEVMRRYLKTNTVIPKDA